MVPMNASHRIAQAADQACRANARRYGIRRCEALGYVYEKLYAWYAAKQPGHVADAKLRAAANGLVRRYAWRYEHRHRLRQEA
jgi:hypothetical protein